MRVLEQQMVCHGTQFLVRRVYASSARCPSPVNYRLGMPGMGTPNTHVIFYNGKYLARVRKRDLKRWLNYYGKQVLTLGHV